MLRFTHADMNMTRDVFTSPPIKIINEMEKSVFLYLHNFFYKTSIYEIKFKYLYKRNVILHKHSDLRDGPRRTATNNCNIIS